jgi:ribosomal protein L29
MKDLQTRNIADLTKLIADKRTAIQAFHFGLAGGKVKNVREARNLRREIAQILTVLKVKSLETK